ncbi:MAG: type IV pilus modification protein PilV [Burkholderiales bacterium]
MMNAFCKCHQTVIRGRCRKQFGLSLVEVLVTLVVVALGLLGIAGLQVSALKLGLVAENRSNSVVYANNIIDRMRANIANAASYVTAFGSAAPTGSTQAEKDLADFKAQIASTLPEGDAEILVAQSAAADCEAPTVAKCWDVTVSLRWNEANVQGGKSGAAQSFLKISSRL